MMSLHYEAVQKKHLDQYKAFRRQRYISKAASQLWAEGVAWTKALEIVSSAFEAVTCE